MFYRTRKMDGSRAAVVAYAILLAVSDPIFAEEPSQGFRQCSNEANDAKRLACYDREAGRVAPAKELKAVTQAAESARTPEQNFGYRGNVARDEIQKKDDEQLKEISATVTALTMHPRGEYTLTLDNGQVWTQKAAGRSIKFKVGDRVTLKQGVLGAIWLVTPDGKSTAVTRNR